MKFVQHISTVGKKSEFIKIYITQVWCMMIHLILDGCHIQGAWDDSILRLVVRSLGDSVEKCRELAIQLISSVTKKLPRVRLMSSLKTCA